MRSSRWPTCPRCRAGRGGRHDASGPRARDHRVRDQRRDVTGEEPERAAQAGRDRGRHVPRARRGCLADPRAQFGHPAPRRGGRPRLSRGVGADPRAPSRHALVSHAVRGRQRGRDARAHRADPARSPAALLGDRSGLHQPRHAGRGGPSAGHRLCELLRRHPLRLRAVRAAPARAEPRDLRAGLPARRARLSSCGPPPARRDGEALLRRALRCDGDAPRLYVRPPADAPRAPRVPRHARGHGAAVVGERLGRRSHGDSDRRARARARWTPPRRDRGVLQPRPQPEQRGARTRGGRARPSRRAPDRRRRRGGAHPRSAASRVALNAADARRFAPATQRNRGPILAVLERVVPARGLVLEIASGTGEHAVAFAQALPALVFQPSDADPDALASIEAWRRHSGLPNVLPPLVLDVHAPWPLRAVPDAILCSNLIHIAPWSACLALLDGAAAALAPGAPLVLYGPFREERAHTAPSNAEFDASLPERDPRWGVRDQGEVAAEAAARGLDLEEVVAMPANNRTLVLRRR